MSTSQSLRQRVRADGSSPGSRADAREYRGRLPRARVQDTGRHPDAREFLPVQYSVHGPGRRRLRAGRIASLVIVLACAIGAWLLYQGHTSEPFADFSVRTESARDETPVSSNGAIPLADLEEIAHGHYLVPQAAQAYRELIAALESAGYTATLNSAYRSLAEQQGLIDTYGLLEEGGTAAPLGTSEHGEGIAVDLGLEWDALVWMRHNAGRFGFAETVPEEPWHWVYVE